QDQVARVAGREAGDLHVVAEHALGVPVGRPRLPGDPLRLLVVGELQGRRRADARPGEELLLEVVAGAPGEHAGDPERLAADVSDHGLRSDPLGRLAVVRTAAAVDVRVAGVVAAGR